MRTQPHTRNRAGIISSIAGLFAAAAMALPHSWQSPAWLRNLRGEFVGKTKGRRGGNRFKPHQGAREMARRRGGQDWNEAKAADRIRRGLPVSWPYQTMEG